MNLYNFTSLTKRQQSKKICDSVEKILFLERRHDREETRPEYEKLRIYLKCFSDRWLKSGNAQVLAEWEGYDRFPVRTRVEVLRKAEYAVKDEAGIKNSESDFINLLSFEKDTPEGKSKPGREIKRLDLELMVCDVRSPFNIGSMIRTAEAFGFARIHLCGISSRCEDKKIFRTSMMAEKFIAIERTPAVGDAVGYIHKMKSAGWKIISLEKTALSKEIEMGSFRAKSLLIVGNEEFGIMEEILSVSDEVRHISLLGVKNSINVAVAFGIAAWMASEDLSMRNTNS